MLVGGDQSMGVIQSMVVGVNKIVKHDWLFIFLFGMCLIGRSTADQPVTLLADHFPPYEFASPNGQALGFDSEVIQLVFKRMQVPLTFEFQPWKRVVAQVKQGLVAGMFSCALTEKRKEYVYYSDPISTATQGVVVSRFYDGPSIHTLKDLHNIQVASISGYAANSYLEQEGIEFISISHISHGFPMLSHKRFDALFLSLEAGRYMAYEAGMASSLKFIPLQDIRSRQYHVCFSKLWPNAEALMIQFNEALRQIIASGEYQRIHEKYQ